MKKIPNSSRRLNDQILRALNQIRKPSTAVEIKELLNRGLGWSGEPSAPTRRLCFCPATDSRSHW